MLCLYVCLCTIWVPVLTKGRRQHRLSISGFQVLILDPLKEQQVLSHWDFFPESSLIFGGFFCFVLFRFSNSMILFSFYSRKVNEVHGLKDFSYLCLNLSLLFQKIRQLLFNLDLCFRWFSYIPSMLVQQPCLCFSYLSLFSSLSLGRLQISFILLSSYFEAENTICYF